MNFATSYTDVLEIINAIDPIKYGKTRNYANGSVTKLSPYISRGVISTKQVAQMVLSNGYNPFEIESFLKELAWRDYFQQVWLSKNEAIDSDLKQEQPNVNNYKISDALIQANTGIEAIDEEIMQLYKTGYMHNHMRMYVASVACNIAKSHWKMPAQWMYYNLLDADWASNALSWQWVAGSFSSKKYFANQTNINKYFNSSQIKTFLDIPYEDFDNLNTPDSLKNLVYYYPTTELPKTSSFVFDGNLPTYVYNFYNLDCEWDKHIKANRVLIFEPSFYKKYPVCDRTIQFVLDMAKNIKNIQVYVGEFNDLFGEIETKQIHFKEHPTNKHYKGIQHKRDWMFEDITGYYPSFFSYWKKCTTHIRKLTL